MRNNHNKHNNGKKVEKRTEINLKEHLGKKVNVGVQDGKFIFAGPLSIGVFAEKINRPASEIIRYFFNQKKMYNVNVILNEEQIAELCLNYNLDFEKQQQIDATNIVENLVIDDDEKDLQPRAPIVTIMGHVDHGKTTLLDYIHKTNTVGKESGGITQHINAYQCKFKNFPITFIDTPGHEAFATMRTNGAKLTDIIVLVVAADDGIKPQTLESIKCAKETKTPVIVFINKMDKPNVNPEVVMNQLSDHGLVPEEWGGETITIKGSALTGNNVDLLLENIVALSEIYEFKANPNRLGTGVVLESAIDKGLGKIVTVIVKNGTVRKSDFIIAGSSFGKAKILIDENGKQVEKALPSTPVKVVGFEKLPSIGTTFLVSTKQEEIKALAVAAELQERNERLGEKFLIQEQDETEKKVNIILRTDVNGSLDAIKHLLSQLKVEGANLHIIRSSVGPIAETDIELAKSANAIVIGFNIKPSKATKELATSLKVTVLFYDVIYKLRDDIEQFLLGKLDPVVEEKETGEAKILQLWRHSDVGVIAGCLCTSGEINRNDSARILRNGKVLYTTKIGSMRHFKENVNKVTAKMEFGITLKNVNDLKVEDVIQCFKLVENKPKK